MQVTLISNTNKKDGMRVTSELYKLFGVTLSVPEALSALNLAIELTIPAYDKFILITQGVVVET